MNNVLEDSLFVSQTKKFDEIQSIVRQFSAEYVGNSIIKDNIFAVIQNYARKKEIALELLRYPIHDDELWALTFLKQDTIFVCVNTALPLCKQFFAAAHELYHIYCYVENADQSYIKNGSMSANSIADQLNSEGVLAPSEYKRLCGLNYHSGFKTGTHAKWQAIQVLRILKNEVYTGTMVQGKRQKINYKDAITLVSVI